MAAPTWVKKAILARRSQYFFTTRSAERLAVKKAMVEMIDATKASKTKKCPICPGNKCSPSNCINYWCFEGGDWIIDSGIVPQLFYFFLEACSFLPTSYLYPTLSACCPAKVFSSTFLSSLYLLGHFNRISLHSK